MIEFALLLLAAVGTFIGSLAFAELKYRTPTYRRSQRLQWNIGMWTLWVFSGCLLGSVLNKLHLFYLGLG